MPARRRKKPSVLVIFVLLLNAAGALAILTIFLAYFLQRSARAAPQPEPALTLPLTTTPIPTRYNLPTITPNPRSTEIVVETPTPFVLMGLAPGVIGYSVSGRPIEVYSFGQGAKQYMIVAGIHGGYEWNTIVLADQLIRYLNVHPEIIPQDDTLYILRDLNPDGDARDHGIDGRVNDHGVDLNRNFPINWSATWDRSGCFDQAATTSGSGPGSEMETHVIMNFLNLHQVQALISYHSAALGIFPGGTPWDPASVRLAQAIAAVSTYPFPPVETGCVYTGTLADYAVSRGAAAVDMELSDHEHTEFSMNLKVLNVLLNFKK